MAAIQQGAADDDRKADHFGEREDFLNQSARPRTPIVDSREQCDRRYAEELRFHRIKRHEIRNVQPQRDRQPGRLGGPGDHEHGPTEKKPGQRAIGFAQVYVLSASSGHSGAQLGAGQRSDERRNAREDPNRKNGCAGGEIAAPPDWEPERFRRQ